VDSKRDSERLLAPSGGMADDAIAVATTAEFCFFWRRRCRLPTELQTQPKGIFKATTEKGHESTCLVASQNVLGAHHWCARCPNDARWVPRTECDAGGAGSRSDRGARRWQRVRARRTAAEGDQPAGCSQRARHKSGGVALRARDVARGTRHMRKKAGTAHCKRAEQRTAADSTAEQPSKYLFPCVHVSHTVKHFVLENGGCEPASLIFQDYL
jgi:hypothetical protein